MDRFGPDEPLVKQSPWSRYVIPILFGLATVIIAIVLLIVAIVAHNNVASYEGAVNDFVDNWRTKPIVDITTALSDCPAGYESKNL